MGAIKIRVNKPLLVAVGVSITSVYLLMTFVFMPEKGESYYYEQYLQMSDSGDGLYRHSSGKVDAYIERMRQAIVSTSKESITSNNTQVVEAGQNSSGEPNTITGDFQQYSDGFTVDGVTIHVDPNSDRGKVVAAALSMLGDPYVYGGTGDPFQPGMIQGHTWKDPKYTEESRIGLPSYDCSGFCQAAYKKGIGMDIPRSSGAQAAGGRQLGVSLHWSEMKPGDLAANGSHAVMVLSDGYMIEAPSSGKTVTISKISEKYGSDYLKNSWHGSFTCVSYLD